MKFLLPLCITSLAILTSHSSVLHAQTISSGTYNLPADGNFGDSESIDSDTTINIFDGGSIGDDFEVGLSSQSENNFINLFGGSIGDNMHAFLAGSEINIDGGSIGDHFSGRNVTLTDGSIGERFQMSSSAGVLNMSGGTLGRLSRASGEVNFSGGSIADHFDLSSSSVLNMTGGHWADTHDSMVTSILTAA